MAWITQGITSYIGGYVDEIVGGALRAGGKFAGDAVGSVGNGINSFGSGVESSVRRYGDGVKDYGNAIKDWTDADGPRNTTAANPLGLPNSITGGKRALGWSKSSSSVSSSPAFRAPSAVGSKAAIKVNSTPRTLPTSAKGLASATVAKKPTARRVPIAGGPVKKKAVPSAKSSVGTANGAKRVPMAGPTMTRNRALAKPKKK